MKALNIIMILVIVFTIQNCSPSESQIKADQYYNKGIEATNKNKLNLAQKTFEKSLELDPNNAKTLYNLAVILTKKKDYKNAIKYFDKAIAIDPTLKANALYNKGLCLAKLKDYKNAKIEFDKAEKAGHKNSKNKIAFIDSFTKPDIVKPTIAKTIAEKPVEIKTINPDNVFVLAVGISKYKPQNGIPSLKYSDIDAKRINLILQTKLKIPKRNISILTNEKADSTTIIDKLRSLVRVVKDKERMGIFYFSGHGGPKVNDRGELVGAYLLPYDANLRVPEKSCISMNEIKMKYQNLKEIYLFF